jgi:hypothetical protein
VVIERPVKGESGKKPVGGTQTPVEALNLCLGYILGSQNHSAASPQREGLFLFYDLDADTYRNGQWPWSWGTAIKLLLEASRLDRDLLDYSPETLQKAAWEIGNCSLKFQILNPESPADNFGTSRYTVRAFEKYGYQELINAGSDTGFLAGWGWIPLYEETRDERFLEAAKKYIRAMEPVIWAYPLPPQEWLPASNGWTGFTIDESGFGTVGINGVFQATGDAAYRQICLDYMEKHLAVFEREDGLWNRQYTFSTGEIAPTEYMARGLGWAMMGLLAAYKCTDNKKYLDKARKMAAVMTRYQRPDGSWTFKLDKSEEQVGTADKGTALWCFLLYWLYEETRDLPVLTCARRALQWCGDNQYTGDNPHARGGIVSPSGESGVTYRSWFRMCCQYTSAFFGLALLEEMKLRKQGI